MLVRRDGSIDLRVLMSRVVSYGAVVVIALILGALVSLVGA